MSRGEEKRVLRPISWRMRDVGVGEAMIEIGGDEFVVVVVVMES